MDPFKNYYLTLQSGMVEKQRYKEFIEHPNFEINKHFYHVDPLTLDAGYIDIMRSKILYGNINLKDIMPSA